GGRAGAARVALGAHLAPACTMGLCWPALDPRDALGIDCRCIWRIQRVELGHCCARACLPAFYSDTTEGAVIWGRRFALAFSDTGFAEFRYFPCKLLAEPDQLARQPLRASL